MTVPSIGGKVLTQNPIPYDIHHAVDGPAKSQSPVENGGKHPIIGFQPSKVVQDFATIHSMWRQQLSHGISSVTKGWPNNWEQYGQMITQLLLYIYIHITIGLAVHTAHEITLAIYIYDYIYIYWLILAVLWSYIWMNIYWPHVVTSSPNDGPCMGSHPQMAIS